VSIFFGAAEITGGKINLGGTPVTEVFFGETKVWPSGTTKYLVANGLRFANAAANIPLAADGDEFILTMTIVKQESTRGAVVASSDRQTFQIEPLPPASGPDINVQLERSGNDFSILPASILEGEAYTLEVTRIQGTNTVDATVNGIYTENSGMTTKGFTMDRLFRADTSPILAAPSGFWDFRFENTTTGDVWTIPMDEGEGLISTVYLNDVPFTTFTWPGAEWIERPTNLN
jgi:hypothetical protein